MPPRTRSPCRWARGSPPLRADFDRKIFVAGTSGGEAWMNGGSYAVIRRIRMLLDHWDGMTEAEQAKVIGRRKADGSPLSAPAGTETTVDLEKLNPDGSPAIPSGAHIRVAAAQSNQGAVILRRGLSYRDGLRPDGAPDTGLLFIAWQADPAEGFIKIQRKLACADTLTTFIPTNPARSSPSRAAHAPGSMSANGCGRRDARDSSAPDGSHARLRCDGQARRPVPLPPVEPEALATTRRRPSTRRTTDPAVPAHERTCRFRPCFRAPAGASRDARRRASMTRRPGKESHVSDSIAAGIRPGLSVRTPGTAASRDLRRLLQLGLAALWLLDGILQFQPFMFTKDFADQVLAPTARGNPSVVADPITWAARIVAHHPVGTDMAFAACQVLLGLGIAWRATRKAALAASIVWSVAVWWLGEGLGGLLTGNADPVNGAPGAVLLYALVAVLLWPTDRRTTATGQVPPRTVAERPVGTIWARALWGLVWAGEACLALQPAKTGPQGLHDMVAGMASGEPGWLAAIETHAAAALAHRGLAASIALAVLLALVAASVWLPTRPARAGIVLAIALTAAIWVVGQALGGIFTGQATDPNSGPLLALIALAYWPHTAAQASTPDRPAQQVEPTTT